MQAGSLTLEAFRYPESSCAAEGWTKQGHLMPEDDTVFQIGLCVPLDQQSRARARLNDSSKSLGKISQPSAVAAVAADADDAPARTKNAGDKTAETGAGAKVQLLGNASAWLVRHCNADYPGENNKGRSDYDGQVMRCVRQYCPPETLGLLRLAACDLCDGKEPLIHFSQ
jgi:hypothetical protein